MPGHAFAVTLRFADEVGGKKCQVITQDRCDQAEDFRVQSLFKQFRVQKVGHIHGLWT